MPPTIIFIRHAEAEHNYTIHDPALTERGLHKQCPALKAALEAHPLAESVDLILSSPLYRTLQTAHESIPESFAQRIQAVAGLQEITNNNIDIGRPASELKEIFDQKYGNMSCGYPTQCEHVFCNIDFSQLYLDKTWPTKTGPYAYLYEMLTQRVMDMKTALRALPNKTVVVISHDGFLRLLTKRKYGHADFRVFNFDDAGELVEMVESEANSGGRGTCPKGRFGWIESDFRWMPNPPLQELIDRELAVTKAMGEEVHPRVKDE